MLDIGHVIETRRAARRRIRQELATGTIWGAGTPSPYWALVMRTPTGWRMTTFDQRGFTGHTDRRNLDEVAELLLSEFGARCALQRASLLNDLQPHFDELPPEGARKRARQQAEGQ